MIRFLLLFSPLLSSNSHAQTPLEMEEIKITATRNAEQLETQSRNITVIDKLEINQVQVTSVPQTVAHLPNLKLVLSVNNLTDQYYRVAFQELYMPGRDVRLAVRYQF